MSLRIPQTAEEQRAFDIEHGIHVHRKIGADDFGRRDWIVPGVLARSELSVLFGEPGTGKSMFAIDHACRLAAGMVHDGHQLEYYTLYIATERHKQVRRRIDAFCVHHGIQPLQGNLVTFSASIDLAEPGDDLYNIYSAACSTATDVIDLIIIDTLPEAMSRPDSEPSAMQNVVRNIKAVFRESCDAPHIMLVTHPALADKTRPRGGSQLVAAADVTIRVTKKGDISTARVIKNNDSEARPSWRYRMESVDLGEDITAPVAVPLGDAPEAQDDAPAPLKGVTLAMSRALEIASEEGPASLDAWRERYISDCADDVTPSTRRQRFGRGKKSLLELGLVTETDGLFSLAVTEA